MTNRIREVHVSNPLLDPATTHVWIAVYPDELTSTTQVRGRLMGPRCVYATTVEVAYPLREISREYATTGTPRITVRVVIPEASFWDPESPFLYEGPLELWQGGQCCEQRLLRHGLRQLTLGPRGLRWNGRPLMVRGVARSTCSEAEARLLRQVGYNTLLVDVRPETAGVWDAADRLGFLVLGRIEMADPDQRQQVQALAAHPCCLGWLLRGAEGVPEERVVAGIEGLRSPWQEQLVGVELAQPPRGPLPTTMAFVACTVERLPELGAVPLPRLVLGGEAPGAAPEILGWIGT